MHLRQFKKSNNNKTLRIYLARKDKYIWCSGHVDVVFEFMVVQNKNQKNKFRFHNQFDVTRDNICNLTLTHSLVHSCMHD